MTGWQSQQADKTLADNEVHIWLNFLNAHQARIKHLYPLLSDIEKHRSEQFKFYKHRKAFIASHGFLHTVLAYYIKTPDNGIQFSYGKQGKPSIIARQNPEGIQFNLSHSGNLAILAVCRNNALGVDIEHAKRESDWKAISQRFFTDSEQKKLFKLNSEKQKDAFFQIWTRKEAHMKVTGRGLNLAPTQFEISIPPEAANFIKNIKTTDNNYYKMEDIVLPDMYKDYSACLSAAFDFARIKYFIHS